MVKPEILHLFLLKGCRHKCPLCCNNLYDIDKDIPVATVEELKTVHTVCLTGGEPFLVKEISKLAVNIKKQYPNIERVYSYTSGLSLLIYLNSANKESMRNPLEGLDGVTISPKDKLDWNAVNGLLGNEIHLKQLNSLSSNRIYVFVEDEEPYKGVKDNVEKSNFHMIERYWDEEFKTPENEIFRRLPILLDR